MKPVDPEDMPGELVHIGAGQPQYMPLPARIVGGGAVHTRWQLTFEERQAILDGACIDLTIMTFGQPLQPLMMTVQGVDVQENYGQGDASHER